MPNRATGTAVNAFLCASRTDSECRLPLGSPTALPDPSERQRRSSQTRAPSAGRYCERRPFAEGKLIAKLKSEPVPESQDKSVYYLVGSEFDDVVFNDDKDVFVEFYATWCGHCKRLKPTWDSLGDKYAALKDRIVIAKMEATENDLPPSVPFRVSLFPTLKFKKAGSREFIDYEGDRSLESLIEFVETNTVNPLDAAVPFKGSKPAAAEETPSESPKVAQPTEDAHAGHDHNEL